jgi:hypothetical protein
VERIIRISKDIGLKYSLNSIDMKEDKVYEEKKLLVSQEKNRIIEKKNNTDWKGQKLEKDRL